MATLQDQMRMDSQWIKTNPATDININTRTHGQHYIYNYAPNLYERTEMSMRSIGKQYDWDLEKYRNAKKPADRGNKRRFFKNVFRFIKNPIGYSFWKSQRMVMSGRLGLVIFYAMFPFSFLYYYKMSILENKKKYFFHLLGEEDMGNITRHDGHKAPKRIYPTNWFDRFPLTSTDSSNYVVNPTYRQNFKKHNAKIKSRKEVLANYYGGSSSEGMIRNMQSLL